MAEPTPMEDYLFDLRGYIILRNAVSKEDVRALNTALDPYVSMETGEWRGWVHRYKNHTGLIRATGTSRRKRYWNA